MHDLVILIDKTVPKSVLEYDFDGIAALNCNMIDDHIDKVFQDGLFNGCGKV